MLGVSRNTICPGESVDFWDDFSQLNQREENYVFTIDFSDGTKETKSHTHCYFQHFFQKVSLEEHSFEWLIVDKAN